MSSNSKFLRYIRSKKFKRTDFLLIIAADDKASYQDSQYQQHRNDFFITFLLKYFKTVEIYRPLSAFHNILNSERGRVGFKRI